MKYSKLFVIILTSMLFASCGASIEEEIKIDESGKGSYSIQSDMIPMMRNMAYKMNSMMKKDGEADAKIDSSEIEAKLFKKMPEYVDSTLDIMSKIDEEKRKDTAFMKVMNNTRVFMQGGSKSKKMNIGMLVNFDDIEEVNLIGKYSKSNSSKELGSKLKLNSSTNLFSFKNNQLSKTIQKDSSKKEDKATEHESLDMFYKDFKYITTIRSKRKIKSVQGENIKSQSDSLVIFEYNLLDYMNGDANQNFTIFY